MIGLARAWKSARNRAETWGLRARGARSRWLNAFAWSAGPGLELGRAVNLTVYGELRLGARVHLADGCHLAVGPGATLTLGDGVFVGRGTVIVAAKHIVVGPRVLIAEHCSIRDGDHELEGGARAVETALVSSPVTIGQDVWIGAGARVLRGSTIRDGCVVAANAVVRGTFGPYELVAGVPARVKRSIGPPKER